MVFSEKADPELLVRCMRAGAREFLSFPLEAEVMEEAFVRASARKPQAKTEKKTAGRLLTFMGAKGGAGATMLACNFAVALAKESGQKTVLIDLDLPLGDAALNMGITAEFSTIDALNSVERMDGAFLDQLLVKHSSGVVGARGPGKVPAVSGEHGRDRLAVVCGAAGVRQCGGRYGFEARLDGNGGLQGSQLHSTWSRSPVFPSCGIRTGWCSNSSAARFRISKS